MMLKALLHAGSLKRQKIADTFGEVISTWISKT
jgi:hypothetical protein